MFGVLTDHPDDPFSFYDLTFVADFFDRGSNFHCRYPMVEEIGFKLSTPSSFFLRKRRREEWSISPEK